MKFLPPELEFLLLTENLVMAWVGVPSLPFLVAFS
jgi:hypothetical protein